jgi:hypothetical protein
MLDFKMYMAGDFELDKKVPLFEFETFAVRKVKCVEPKDLSLPRKRDR